MYLVDLPGELHGCDLVRAGRDVADVIERFVLHLPRIEQRGAAIAREARVEVRAIRGA